MQGATKYKINKWKIDDTVHLSALIFHTPIEPTLTSRITMQIYKKIETQAKKKKK